MSDLIEINPRKLGGKPVFRGTRIPISYLSQYLNEGRSVQDFIDDFDIDPTLVRKVYQEEFEDDAKSGEKRAACRRVCEQPVGSGFRRLFPVLST